MSSKVSDVSEAHGESEAVEPSSVPLFFIFLCTLCMSSLYANILTYNVTVNMVHSYGNDSDSDYYDVADYRRLDNERINITVKVHRFLSNPQKEALITVVPIGGMIAFVPVTLMYNAIGFRRSFVATAIICLIPSLLVPICTSAKTYVLAIIVRIFQGFALASFAPYVCKLSVYIPFTHTAIPSIVFAYIQIAAFFSIPISALLSWSSLGWHAAHYGGALVTFLLFLFFLFINFDDEFKEKVAHYGVMDAIWTYERSRSRILSMRLPYLSIYQDINVWACMFSALGYFTTVQLYIQWGPTFLHKVADIGLVPTGFFSMIPPFSNFIISFVTYGLYSKLANTPSTKLRIFNSLGTVIPGILFIVIGCIDAPNLYGVATTLFLIASSLLGFCSCGFFKMVQKRACQYHLFLIVNLFAVNLVSMFLVSLLNVLIAKDNEYTSWAVVFIVQGCILLVTNTIFCLFASEEKAHWTKEGFEDTSIQPRRDDPLPQRPL